ncbi:MAG: response regulator [Nitrospirota bacterium]|nr:response regulator [Nitrospirota bacterium]
MARKLLLADDSITIQKVVELILAEEGFEIKATNNGEEALAVIPSFKPDIILADIEMPKINGYQLSEKIKQDPLMRGIPVILLAGVFEPIDEELAKQVNADDFIIKPFESQELISKINAALTISSVAEGEEVEGIAEAEAVGLEEVPVEEDLWSMEEIPETAEVESWSMEEAVVAGTEELLEIAEEAGVEAAAVEEVTPPVVKEAAATEVKIGIPEVEFPSKDELKDIFEHTVNERISSLLSSLDLKEIILTSLMPSMKDSVEKILWEVAPDLVERMLKEMLKGALESLTKEVEKVIWETVPDLAKTMISKEIERIRSEF